MSTNADLEARIAELEAEVARLQEVAAACTSSGEEDLQQFKLLVESAPDGFIISPSDAATQVIYANMAYKRMMGYDDAIYKTPLSDMLVQGQDDALGELAQAVISGGSWQGELLHRRQDGSIFPAMVSTFGIPGSGGADNTMPNIATIVRDITEYKEASRLLQETKTRLDIILSNLPIVLYQIDKDGTMLLSEGKGLASLGLKPGQVVGMSVYDLYKDSPQILESIQRTLAGENLYNTIMLGPLAFESWYLPLHNAAGDVTGMLGISIDVTEQKTAENERTRLQEEVINAQQQALREISTPIIPIMERILIMPIVGTVDTQRARDIMRALLSGITENRAKVIILDITGVAVLDTGVVDHLNKTIQAARLKGARTIVTGVSNAVAETMVDLGIDWREIETLRDLQSGLVAAMRHIGAGLTV